MFSFDFLSGNTNILHRFKGFEINFGIILKQNYLYDKEIWKNKFQLLFHKIGIFSFVQYFLQVCTNRDTQSSWKAIGVKVEGPKIDLH